MNLDYVLTDAAEADLRGIIRYTRKQYGVAQFHCYIADIGAGITRLVAREGVFKDMSALCHLGAASRHERKLAARLESDVPLPNQLARSAHFTVPPIGRR